MAKQKMPAPPLPKRVQCRLAGLGGDAHSLMSVWQKAAKQEGWTQEQIKSVLDEATSSNYSHLLATLAEHCVNGGC